LDAALAEPVESPTYLPPTDTFRLFSLALDGNAKATLAAEGNAARVDVTAVDGTAWHAQLAQRFDDLQEGATYTVRFRAKADIPRRMKLWGEIAEPDWHCIDLDEEVSLTEAWQTYQCSPTCTPAASTAWRSVKLSLRKRSNVVTASYFRAFPQRPAIKFSRVPYMTHLTVPDLSK
jgi:hypothetical protein